MTENAWTTQAGRDAIAVLTEAGLLKWCDEAGFSCCENESACSDREPHYRDAARVFMERHNVPCGHNDRGYWFQWMPNGCGCETYIYDTVDERDVAAVLAVEKGKP